MPKPSSEAQAHCDALVLFGITGDLAKKKLFPAVYHMVREGSLGKDVPVVGVSSSEWSTEELVERARESVAASLAKENLTLDEDAFRELFPSAQGAYILSGSGSDVTEHVTDAIEHDSHAAARRRTTEYLLGDSPSDPVTRFVEAVDTVLSKQQQITADHA